MVQTDHQPLVEFFKGKSLHGKLARWHLSIIEFNPTIRNIKGKENVVADALSGHHCVASVPIVPTLSIDMLRKEQRNDPFWKHVIYSLESGDDTRLDRIPIPLEELFLGYGILMRETV